MGNKAITPNPGRQKRILLLMERENLSQKELGIRMGEADDKKISQQRISEFLREGKISDYYFNKICSAFPNYLREWLDGYGDDNIATIEDRFRYEFDNSVPIEHDVSSLFSAIDNMMDRTIDRLKSLDSDTKVNVLLLFNKMLDLIDASRP